MLRRMHKVIVLSGISLAAACSGRTEGEANDGGADGSRREDVDTGLSVPDANGWKHEGPQVIAPDASDARDASDAWIHEGIDAGPPDAKATDAGPDFDAWIQEGPSMIDGGS